MVRGFCIFGVKWRGFYRGVKGELSWVSILFLKWGCFLGDF